jgi:ubiquitin
MEQLPVLRSGRRRTGKDRRLMIPTLCVRNQICHSTLVSGTQRIGHPQYGGGKKQRKKAYGTRQTLDEEHEYHDARPSKVSEEAKPKANLKAARYCVTLPALDLSAAPKPRPSHGFYPNHKRGCPILCGPPLRPTYPTVCGRKGWVYNLPTLTFGSLGHLASILASSGNAGYSLNAWSVLAMSGRLSCFIDA